MFNNERFNNFVQFFITYLLMPLLFVFILVICLIIFANTSHAADYYDGSLPYKFEFIDDLNSWTRYNDLGDSILSAIESYGLPINDDDYVLILTDFGFYNDESNYHIYRAWFLLVPIDEFTSSTSNIFSQAANFNVLSSPTTYYFGVHFDVYGGFNPIVFNVDTNPTFTSSLFGHQSVSATIVPNNDPFIVTSHVPFYFSKNFYYNNSLVLEYEPISPIGVGVAIIPPNAITPEYPSGTTAPGTVPPTYTSTDYTWTTPPTFDGSSVENALGSIQNLLGWLANNLKEEFKNLTSNLKGFFEYIGQTIQYYGNAILQTLNNFIQNFYDNMKSLIEPIFDKIAYITEEVDSQEINAALSNTSFIGLKNQFNSFFTTFESAFDISEPNTFTLVINIQNIDTFYNFGCRSPVVIHLDEHFIPIRTSLRTFLWILISFGTVFVVERGLSDWLRGENDTK